MAREDYLRRSPIRFDAPDYQVCYDYWLRLKGDRWAPAWRDWDWMELPVHLIPYFLVVDVSYDPLDFVYRFYGTASITMHNMDFTGKSIDAIRSPITARNTRAQYMDVVDSRQAIGSEYTIQAGAAGPPYVQTSLRMPMSDTKERVDQIVTFVDWRNELERIQSDHIKEFGA